MLAALRKSSAWNWAAIGKHPVAKDYIRIGTPSPLIEALGEWVANGYRQLNPAKEPPRSFYSWRFWLRGIKKGEIICGLGRDSSDRIGRPYPLLIAGQGLLKGWEKKWIELPRMLGRSWQSMEYIAARRFDELDALESALAGLEAPEKQIPAAAETEMKMPAGMAAFHQELDREGIAMVRLNHEMQDDSEAAVRQYHLQLEGCCRQIPRGVFVGGTPQQTGLVAVQHPLGKADFLKLWSW